MNQARTPARLFPRGRRGKLALTAYPDLRERVAGLSHAHGISTSDALHALADGCTDAAFRRALSRLHAAREEVTS